MSGLHQKLLFWRGKLNKNVRYAKKLYVERIPFENFWIRLCTKKIMFVILFLKQFAGKYTLCAKQSIVNSLQMVCNTRKTACNQNSVDIIHNLIIERWKGTYVSFVVCSLHYFFGNLCWLSKLALNVVSTLLKICRIFDPFQGLLCLHVNAQHETKHFFFNGHTRT